MYSDTWGWAKGNARFFIFGRQAVCQSKKSSTSRCDLSHSLRLYLNPDTPILTSWGTDVSKGKSNGRSNLSTKSTFWVDKEKNFSLIQWIILKGPLVFLKSEKMLVSVLTAHNYSLEPGNGELLIRPPLLLLVPGHTVPNIPGRYLWTTCLVQGMLKQSKPHRT